MKKVRLALGAVGAAPAAMGLMVATAANAAPDAHAAPAQPAFTGCPAIVAHHTRTVQSHPSGLFSGTLKYQGNCAVDQKGVLDFGQNGLVERVRFRSVNSALVRQTFPNASVVNSQTKFASAPATKAHLVCEAIVLSANHSDVLYGPVCQDTS